RNFGRVVQQCRVMRVVVTLIAQGQTSRGYREIPMLVLAFADSTRSVRAMTLVDADRASLVDDVS
ncbi:MAG TPA: hypothetical protein VFN13_08105, partial [Rudaea sp.]|nr:hypothetical protein [Rudaea sp.]